MVADTLITPKFTVEFVRPPVAHVSLISWPNHAVDALATVVRGYKQVYSEDPPELDERAKLLADINRTKLHTPLEMLTYVWLVRNVSRAFTHQMVRTRVGAAYVQESMRFSDKRRAAVLVPPAIAADAGRLGAYKEAVGEAFSTYAQLLEAGVPVQDARSVLPHGTLTHIFVSYTLSTLAKTAALRYCCQAQAMTADGEGEWRTVLEAMKATLPPPLQQFVAAPWETGEVSCGFEASFDRPCRFLEKFRPNYEALKARMEPAAPPPAWPDEVAEVAELVADRIAAARAQDDRTARRLAERQAAVEAARQALLQTEAAQREMRLAAAALSTTYGATPAQLLERMGLDPEWAEGLLRRYREQALVPDRTRSEDFRAVQAGAALDGGAPRRTTPAPAQPAAEDVADSEPPSDPELDPSYLGALAADERERAALATHTLYRKGDVWVGVRPPEMRMILHFSTNLLRTPVPAISIFFDMLERAVQLGAEVVRVLDLDSQMLYSTTVQEVRENGRRVQGMGYGPQLALPLINWRARPWVGSEWEAEDEEPA